jgi:hypothetical protein
MLEGIEEKKRGPPSRWNGGLKGGMSHVRLLVIDSRGDVRYCDIGIEGWMRGREILEWRLNTRCTWQG